MAAYASAQSVKINTSKRPAKFRTKYLGWAMGCFFDYFFVRAPRALFGDADEGSSEIALFHRILSGAKISLRDVSKLRCPSLISDVKG